LFGARSISDDGLARYALVRSERLPAVRQFFAVARVSCGNVAPGASHYGACQTFARLATAADVADYCAIRADQPDRKPIEGLGAPAFIAADGAYVLHAGVCVETYVRRKDAYDPKRTEALARLVVSRLP
jgi:hypothetical protein